METEKKPNNEIMAARNELQFPNSARFRAFFKNRFQ